jgi:hypothetical protein
MRRAMVARLFAAVLIAGCGARAAPPAEVVVSEAPPKGSEPEAPLPVQPAKPRPEACTQAGARFRDPKLAPKPLTPAQEHIIAEARAFAREHAGDRRADDQLAEHAYAEARTLFEAYHWAEAALAFREVAMRHPHTEAGIYAAQLYLESLNVLGTQTGRESCYDDMKRDVPLIVDRYCTGPARKTNADACDSLDRVERDIDRLAAESLVRRADNGGPGAAELYERAGTAYLALARRCCVDALQRYALPQDERCDELAYNAGVALLRGTQPALASQALGILDDPKNTLARSPLRAKLAQRIQSPPGP